MMAAAALVILGVLLVVLGVFAAGRSVQIMGLGVVALIAAGAPLEPMSRRT